MQKARTDVPLSWLLSCFLILVNHYTKLAVKCAYLKSTALRSQSGIDVFKNLGVVMRCGPKTLSPIVLQTHQLIIIGA